MNNELQMLLSTISTLGCLDFWGAGRLRELHFPLGIHWNDETGKGGREPVRDTQERKQFTQFIYSRVNIYSVL